MSSVDILVPDLPESVTDATVITWHKKPGDSVQRDEVLVEIETDKVVLEISAPEAGVIETLLEYEGATVSARQILGYIRLDDNICQITSEKSNNQEAITTKCYTTDLEEKNNANLAAIKSSSIDKCPINEDVEKYIIRQHNAVSSSAEAKDEIKTTIINKRSKKRIPMTSLRKRMTERLLEVKNSTAVLTTFNEVNMQTVINLRKQYGDAFEKRHGVRLGFMPFYIKAVLEALKRFPEVNASIDDKDVIYYNYFDISIAVSTSRGLVTPVLKDIDALSMAEIEKKIKELAIKSRNNQLKVEELTGGNFTITNSGTFGSLMSTPIINPPQSAILGIHAIKDRPIAVRGQVVIMPIMYLALSYDHRLIDGKESVNFLVTVKDILEDPIRLLLDI